MTNWENKGEGKQDKEKILFLAITYFFCCLLQPCLSRAWAAPQGAASTAWPWQPWNQSTSQSPPPVQVHGTGWSNRGARKGSVGFGWNSSLLRLLESPSSLLIHQVKNKFILLPVTTQKHHLIEQTRQKVRDQNTLLSKSSVRMLKLELLTNPRKVN